MRNLERIKVILSATNFESLAVCYQLTYELFAKCYPLIPAFFLCYNMNASDLMYHVKACQ